MIINIYLILTLRKPFHPASSQRISKWIKSAFVAGGVDLSRFSSYSTRHAATSAAARAGVSIEMIRRAAGWIEKATHLIGSIIGRCVPTLLHSPKLYFGSMQYNFYSIIFYTSYISLYRPWPISFISSNQSY